MRLLALVFLFTTSLHGEDWTTNDGKVLRNVKVMHYDAATVTVLDQDGGVRIPLINLPATLQRKFDYDPAKARMALAQEDAVELQTKRDLQKQEARRIIRQTSAIIVGVVVNRNSDSSLTIDCRRGTTTSAARAIQSPGTLDAGVYPYSSKQPLSEIIVLFGAHAVPDGHSITVTAWPLGPRDLPEGKIHAFSTKAPKED